MEEKNLKQIDGKKIRRQYFSAPLIILVYSMISTSYGILVLDLMTGKFVLSDWLSGVLISFEICLVFSIPFLLLSILNRTCFGKIICVVNPDGIHHKDGLTRWSDIIKVEYVVEGKTYTKRKWIGAGKDVPAVGSKLTVLYCSTKPNKAKIL